jgi:hypothetical protein
LLAGSAVRPVTEAAGGGVAGLGGALLVAGLDRFVVADAALQAMPENFQPEVAEGA